MKPRCEQSASWAVTYALTDLHSASNATAEEVMEKAVPGTCRAGALFARAGGSSHPEHTMSKGGF